MGFERPLRKQSGGLFLGRGRIQGSVTAVRRTAPPTLPLFRRRFYRSQQSQLTPRQYGMLVESEISPSNRWLDGPSVQRDQPPVTTVIARAVRPVAIRPHRGRAVRCTAGDADCHSPYGLRNDTVEDTCQRLGKCGAYRYTLSFRGRASDRGNPFSFRPLWGRAVRCTAGDTDCHSPYGLRNDRGGRGLVPLHRGTVVVPGRTAERS